MSLFVEEKLDGPIRGTFVAALKPNGTGIVVLGGSSGRVDVPRAHLFARTGVHALALQWFGGRNQAAGICEIPLEVFTDATDFLISKGCQRVIFIGTSKGAEAALLASTLDHRIRVVIAISPSSVVWGNIGPGIDGIAWPERSSWSFRGQPLSFVPAILDWQPEYREQLISYRSFFQQCLVQNSHAVASARILIEKSPADMILIAGCDDALWPSEVFATELSAQRRNDSRLTLLLTDAEAGHRILLPGEDTPRSALHAHGGNDEADARLGRKAWQAILQIL
ncbi:acyl-CoA thioester hydrolase/BAAT C-terminal domain-containing protein [Rhizobium straminoryzae]|uniref:Acyl-CoA thioesterase n=1 Tax=Rhizobium straminoryzae TaxID=1387186 RepID=A0A549TDH5_9HYPH|nr:acyl-CoA thioester hydrolase/BAAT C-terminal domain-containing protein [Rhizobium straminoryzae]TRL40100.1 acyl-CoA thioesterase [Rhizobium straminoryzae]